MNIRYPKGSEWRIWDLHIHTPASPKFIGKFDEFMNNIETCEADVLGINDYYTLEGYEKIIEERSIQNKVFFPVIELRSNNIITNRQNPDLRKGTKVNFHVIFNNQESVINRAKTWLLSLDCKNSKGMIDQLGNIPKNEYDKISLDYDYVIDKLKKYDLKNDALIWLPYDEYGGIGDIDPKQDGFFKLGMINNADIIGTSNRKQIEFFLWKNLKFSEKDYKKWFKNPLPCIKGSDSHESKYPFGRLKDKNSSPIKKYCWIKADPTFEGLKQVLIEPEERIHIGEIPDKLTEVKNNKDKYIEEISFNVHDKYIIEKNNEEWFDKNPEILFNTGLVAIIGNKGSGKTALTDIISLAGNGIETDFEFLNHKKFLNTTAHKKYFAAIRFKDDFRNICDFIKSKPDSTKDEKVVYLSKIFINRLCDTEKTTSKLEEEIGRVIFSHIPEEAKLGLDTLNQLIDKKNVYINEKIRENLLKLEKTNKEIVDLEELKKPEYKTKIENRLNELKRQLKHIVENEKPKEVKKPNEKFDKSLSQNIEKNSKKITYLKDTKIKIQTDLNNISINIDVRGHDIPQRGFIIIPHPF